MYFKQIHVSSFGPLTDRDFELSNGLNVVYGCNESGKTSLAVFIKFILYGLSSSRGGAPGERQRYVNSKTGEASGYARIVTDGGREITVERKYSASGETVRIVDEKTGTPIFFSGTVGEYLLGVPESVFVNTAFVGQRTGARPDDEQLRLSVENITCAADEKISVKKALAELDRARVALLHKNKTGGRIVELENRRSALRAAVEEDKSNSEETVKVEASLDEIRKKLVAAENNSNDYEELFRALEVLSKKRILDAGEQTEAELEKTKAALSDEIGSCDIDSFEGAAGMCERNFEAVRSAQSKLDSIPEPDGRFVPEDGDEELKEAPLEDISRAERLRSRTGALRTAGIVFAAAGVLGGISAALLGTVFSMSVWFYVAAGAATLAIVAAIFFTLSSKSRADLREILGAWDSPSVDRLVETVKETVRARKENAELKRKIDAARNDLSLAEQAAGESRNMLAEAAAALSVNGSEYEDDRDYLGAVKDAIGEKRAKISALESDKAALEGRLSALREQAADLDVLQVKEDAESVLGTEVGKRASLMGAGEIKEAARRRDFCRGSVIEMRKKEGELDRRLAELKAVAKSPSGTAETLERLDSVIADLRRRHDAYVTATEALSRAGENLRGGVLPRVRKKASDMMREISLGKYENLAVSSGMELFYSDGGETLGVGYLSSGTEDAAYLSLRLALILALFPEDGERTPAVFDESFSRIDEDRLSAALSMICSPSFGLQSILCTCREEGATSAAKHGGRLIRM